MCCMCQTKTGRIMLAVLLVVWIGVIAWTWWGDQPRDGVEDSEGAQTSAIPAARGDYQAATPDVSLALHRDGWCAMRRLITGWSLPTAST